MQKVIQFPKQPFMRPAVMSSSTARTGCAPALLAVLLALTLAARGAASEVHSGETSSLESSPLSVTWPAWRICSRSMLRASPQFPSRCSSGLRKGGMRGGVDATRVHALRYTFVPRCDFQLEFRLDLQLQSRSL